MGREAELTEPVKTPTHILFSWAPLNHLPQPLQVVCVRADTGSNPHAPDAQQTLSPAATAQTNLLR